MKTKSFIVTLFMAMPWVIQGAEPRLVGPVNSSHDEGGAEISADGLTLYFHSKRPGGAGNLDIYYSTRDSRDTGFGPPVNLEDVNTPAGESNPSLSGDGLTLYFTSGRPGGFGGSDIYQAKRKRIDEPFGQAENLGNVVNSKSGELGPCTSADGLTLYFSSTREGGRGASDIWKATRESPDAPFKSVHLLGINTEFPERLPCISRDGLTLYYDYHRPGVTRLRDIWFATRDSVESDFGNPTSLGSPPNGKPGDRSPGVSPDGNTLYFESTRKPGGKEDANLWEWKISAPSGIIATSSTPAPTPAPAETINTFTEITLTDAVPARNLPLASRMAAIQALLVTEVNAADFAGFAQTLSVTAVETGGDAPLSMTFNQPVGSSMKRALEAATRGLQVKYDAWPRGYSVKFAFEEKYVAKDGPSAAVACALLMDSLVHGSKLDPNFAVTGDMNADLTVHPVGGVPSKIRGALKRKCNLVAVPTGNRTAVEDMIILQGSKRTLGKIQIFTIENFEQAKALSLKTRAPEVQKSIDDFARLQNESGSLKAAERTEILEGILAHTPNHLSAELILRGVGRKTLSLMGSFEALERATGPFVAVVRAGKPGAMAGRDFGDAVENLHQIEKKLDRRTVDYHSKVVALFLTARRHAGKTFTNKTQYNAAVAGLAKDLQRADAAFEMLRKNVELIEESAR